MRFKKNNKELAFVILVGGKSKRFGSDKGLFLFDGKPLISHQLEVLNHFSKEVFIVAHSNQQIQNYIHSIDIANLTAFILDDQTINNEDVRSPLIGIYSSMEELVKLNYLKAFVISCDLPFIKKEVIALLIKESENYDCIIPRWKNGFLEPLLAIYPVAETYKSAKENLKMQKFKLTKLIRKKWNTKFISVEEMIQQFDKNLESITNINKNSHLKHFQNKKSKIKKN